MSRARTLSDRFDLARSTYKHRMIASLEGEVGTGKTHLALTAPAPIVLQNIDHGTEGVIEKFRDGSLDEKEIYEILYEWEPAGVVDADSLDEADLTVQQEKEIQAAALALSEKWEKDALYAIENGARTIIQDTESRIWQVYRYSEFGGPSGGNPKDYDQLNLRYERIINRAKAADVNLFLVRSMKDKWGVFSGKFGKRGKEAWGYDHLASCVNEEFTMVRRSEKEQEEARDGMGEYVIRVGKCRSNPAIQFKTLPRCSFAQLGTMVIDGSSEEDWA